MSDTEHLYGERFLPVEATDSILAGYEEGKEVRFAGRMMTRRVMGKSAFFHIKDESGKLQAYVKRDEIGEDLYKDFKAYNIGDILGVEGKLFETKTGEKSVHVTSLKLLSRIVKTLPEKWHGLKDVETRYRQRYVDLIMNDDVRATFKTRSQIVRGIRDFLNDRDFMEVETPMMQSLAGGARAKPFKTHLNSLHLDLYLRVAPELYLKRLLVGGFEKVYEINRNFRNEGISVRHNPEFTMLELYQSYADYNDMMDITEEMVCHLIEKLHGTDEIPFGDKTINFKRPWKRVSFYEALEEKTGIDFKTADVREAAKQLGVPVGPEDEDIDVLNEIFGEKVEADLWDPTFIIDYPTAMSPLAKAKKDDPSVVYRFELFIAKMELANAFSELNDPHEQRKRLEKTKRINW